MLVYEDNFKTTLKEKTYIALGSFDGLHVGHMRLINKTIELAKENNAKSMVFTFKNHPLTIINKDIAPKLIIDNEVKSELLEKCGVDIVNYVNFNNEFMKISPEDFIKNMVKCYNVKGIIVGFNYRFGYKNLGDIELLKKLSIKFRFELNIIEPVKIDDDIVSSSKIRQLVSEGNITKANKFLNRPFMLQGTVIHGKQLGRKINFPTTNLKYNKNFVLPKRGVYYTCVKYNGEIYRGITNIGYNPTVNDKKLSIETHILGFKKDIYDENLRLYFCKRIRSEKKFNSIEELANQLYKDKNFASMQNICLC